MKRLVTNFKNCLQELCHPNSSEENITLQIDQLPLALCTHATYLSTRSEKDHQIDSGVCLLTAVDRSFYSRSLHLYPSHDVVDTEDVCTGMGPQEVGLSERPVEKCFYLFFCSFI